MVVESEIYIYHARSLDAVLGVRFAEGVKMVPGALRPDLAIVSWTWSERLLLGLLVF